MTDNLRDEVRELVEGVTVSNYTTAKEVDETTDAITNLVLGVKELEWHKEGPRWCATPVLDNAVRYVVRKQCSTSWEPYVNGVRLEMGLTYPTLEAAKAACQADFAKRIQSALTANPAPVVSDEMLEAARSVILNVDEGMVLTDAEARSILTAALPHATTEADIRADERERLCEALTPSCETKAAFMGEFSFLIDELDEDGDVRPRKITVPWDTIKEIMAAIRARSQGEGK